MQGRRMSVRMISEAVGIGIGTVDTILTEDLKLHKVCQVYPKDPLRGPKTDSLGMLHGHFRNDRD